MIEIRRSTILELVGELAAMRPLRRRRRLVALRWAAGVDAGLAVETAELVRVARAVERFASQVVAELG